MLQVLKAASGQEAVIGTTVIVIALGTAGHVRNRRDCLSDQRGRAAARCRAAGHAGRFGLRYDASMNAHVERPFCFTARHAALMTLNRQDQGENIAIGLSPPHYPAIATTPARFANAIQIVLHCCSL